MTCDLRYEVANTVRLDYERTSIFNVHVHLTTDFTTRDQNAVAYVQIEGNFGDSPSNCNVQY